MNNKGQITVFISLIISVLLILGIASHKAINVNLAKEKLAANCQVAVSELLSEYNNYIFEHYHILLFDSSFGGKNQAIREEELKSRMAKNLGDNIHVEDLRILEYTTLMEDDCKAFKDQIEEYMLYAAVEYGVEEILNQTDNNDGTVGDDILNDMDNAQNQEFVDSNQEENTEEDTEEDDASIEDPREFTSSISEMGVLSFVLPEYMDVSSVHIDLSHVPSAGKESNFVEIDGTFDDMDVLEEDLLEGGNWSEKLIDGGTGILYSRLVFNCATDTEVNKDTVLEFEREYLIAGKSSDYDNLENVVHRIMAIRFPANFISLLGDSEKMALIDPVAEALFVATGVPAPVYKYLIAGCWSYVESVADVRNLLKGKRVPFMKNSDSWITDLSALETSIYNDTEDTGEGLSYEDYLMILLAVNSDDMYVRMLDLMQINARQEQDDFMISNGAVGVTVTLTGRYLDATHSVTSEGCY